MAQSTDVKEFQEILRGSKNIIAVAGAGLSAASGIPTFRGSGGMWRKYNAMKLATPQGFERSPSLVWQFYHYRREVVLKAKLNNAHRALAAFSQESIRNQISPGSKFTLITQNIDSLSPAANKELARFLPADNLESVDVIEMHGRLFDVLCNSTDCDHVEFNTDSPICGALAGTENLIDKKIMDPIVDLKDLPRCSKCNSLARPGVVWFGEIPHRLDEIDGLVEEADLCLVIGTSAVVYPAAGYSSRVKELGGKVAVFNMEDNDNEADFLFLGPCEELLPMALGLSENPFIAAFKDK